MWNSKTNDSGPGIHTNIYICMNIKQIWILWFREKKRKKKLQLLINS